ncbi:hypothetical protein KR054_007395 [Drosophila jambulina]|nr:hypothetical protein KR054_007395 [Drosophila jambulina]
MKLLLWLVLYCSLAQGGRHNHFRNDNCLKRNRYKHESACRQYPRRNFYAFHRIIFDCIQVTTHCPRMYRHNEYNSLQECRDDCYFIMHMYDKPTTVPPKVNNTLEGPDLNNEGSNDGNGQSGNSTANNEDQGAGAAAGGEGGPSAGGEGGPSAGGEGGPSAGGAAPEDGPSASDH